MYLPSIVFSMNNTENRSTGYSPFFLTYGRNPKTVIDSVINLNGKEKNILQSVTGMLLAQYLAWETSQNNLKLAEKDMKTRYDSKEIQSLIMKADIVYLRIPNLLVTPCRVYISISEYYRDKKYIKEVKPNFE